MKKEGLFGLCDRMTGLKFAQAQLEKNPLRTRIDS